jgi:WD40 repeat protein
MSASPPINAIQFTSKAESMCISLPNGFTIFALATLPPKKLTHRVFEGQQFGDAITIHDSPIIVCTGISGQKSFSNKTLCIFDESLGRVVLEVQCTEEIRHIFMIPSMFAISSRTEVRLYTFDPPILHSLLRTSPNDYAPCDFVECQESFIVALTGRQPGIVRLVRGSTCECRDFSISAHNRPISFLRMNSNGSLVATSSSYGTVIKLFNTTTGDCVGQFRRGTLAAEIQAMEFSPESEWLAVASSKGTVHLFTIAIVPITDLGNVPRSENKVQSPDFATCSLAFIERNTLIAVSRIGTLYILKCSFADKSVTVDGPISFVEGVFAGAK